MVSIILAAIVFTILFISFVIVLFGSSISSILPIAKRLKDQESILSNIWFSKNLVDGKNEPIFSMCDKKLKLTHLAKPEDPTIVRSYIDKYSISSILLIVSYEKNKQIHKLLKSLRMPSFVLLIMAAGSYVSLYEQNDPSFSQILTVWNSSGYELFKLLSLSQLCTFLVTIMRLTVELYIIGDLLEA